jgi:hypothetical protein
MFAFLVLFMHAPRHGATKSGRSLRHQLIGALSPGIGGFLADRLRSR